MRSSSSVQMERLIEIRSAEGEPLAKADVVMFRGGEGYKGETDGRGRVKIGFPHEFCDRLEVDGALVKEDWDVDVRRDLGQVQLQPSDSTSGMQRGVRGNLYYSDGTRVYEHLDLYAEIDHPQFNKRISADDRGSRLDSDGSFFLETQGLRWEGDFFDYITFFVNHQPIDKRLVSDTGGNSVAIVLPPAIKPLGGPGEKGGLITGTVVDREGNPFVGGAKLSGEVQSASMLSFFSDAPTPRADSDEKDGRFILEFEGGRMLKRLAIDGNEPERVYTIDREGNEQDLDRRGIEAGSFNLYLVRKPKFFGLL